MFGQGDIVSYAEMCGEEGVALRRGMNFRPRRGISVLLMSLRPDAPYADRVEENGRVLVYEGHDAPARRASTRPKKVDQPAYRPGGGLTQNGLFYRAAMKHKHDGAPPEPVKVYEKIRRGIWTYNGMFELVDAWQENSDFRKVFKFGLVLTEEPAVPAVEPGGINHTRLVPADVKFEVWKRDGGKCVECGGREDLHFDHVIPYSKGGSSLTSGNIRLLCVRHNPAKSDGIG